MDLLQLLNYPLRAVMQFTKWVYVTFFYEELPEEDLPDDC